MRRTRPCVKPAAWAHLQKSIEAITCLNVTIFNLKGYSWNNTRLADTNLIEVKVIGARETLQFVQLLCARSHNKNRAHANKSNINSNSSSFTSPSKSSILSKSRRSTCGDKLSVEPLLPPPDLIDGFSFSCTTYSSDQKA